MADAANPVPQSYFILKLGGHEVAGFFRECTGLDSETSVIEHKTTDKSGRWTIRKVPGEHKWSAITLKRGIDQSSDLWQWRKKVIDQGPEQARVDGTIELCDWQGKPVATYSFKQGWPAKYTGASLNANSNEVAMEEIQIHHEGLERM